MSRFTLALMSRKRLAVRIDDLEASLRSVKVTAAHEAIERVRAEKDRDDWKASCERQRQRIERLVVERDYLEARVARLTRSLGEPKEPA